MPDRLQEIRDRLDAATAKWSHHSVTEIPAYREPRNQRAVDRLIAHAPEDIAWLLAALESEKRHSAMLSERIDGHLLENVRLLAEVERLQRGSVSERSQDTSLSVRKPLRTENGTELLPDDSAVPGLTERGCDA